VEPSGTAEPVPAQLPGGPSLQPGEQVLAVMYRWWFATAPFHLFTLGLYEFFRVPEQGGVAGPATSDTDDPAASLRQLQALKDQGLLTDDEYAEKRQDILKRL
jgi:hypothetical protein